jgi:hypothetical protein
MTRSLIKKDLDVSVNSLSLVDTDSLSTNLGDLQSALLNIESYVSAMKANTSGGGVLFEKMTPESLDDFSDETMNLAKEAQDVISALVSSKDFSSNDPSQMM